MPNINVGDKAPSFCLPNTYGEEVCLDNYRGKWIVLYFYPRDNTSGCTREALDFTSLLTHFKNNGAVIIGVSPDSIESHRKFVLKYGLEIELLSDVNKEVIRMYGAWGKKKRYGREYEGVIRSTFLIDGNGVVRHVWRNVRVNGHAQKVLEKLIELNSKDNIIPSSLNREKLV